MNAVPLSEVIATLRHAGCSSGLTVRLEMADRIEAHGIEQPSDGRKPIAWEVETKSYGKGYSFSEEFFEAFPQFPCTSLLDALIAEIDGLDVPPMVKLKLGFITNKYRGQK